MNINKKALLSSKSANFYNVFVIWVSNPDLSNSKTKYDQSDNYNEIINQILSQKETKLLTNSQYVSFENQIGDNSCYINVIMHFLYIFPCVNDYLIKKYQEQSKEKEKEKENEKEVTKEPKKEELEQFKNCFYFNRISI